MICMGVYLNIGKANFAKPSRILAASKLRSSMDGAGGRTASRWAGCLVVWEQIPDALLPLSTPTGPLASTHHRSLFYSLCLCLAALPHLLAVSFLAQPCVLSGLQSRWRTRPPPQGGRGALEHVFLGGRHQLAGETFAFSTEPPRAEPGLRGGGCGRTEGEGRLWSARGQVEQISDGRDRWLKQKKREGAIPNCFMKEAVPEP